MSSQLEKTYKKQEIKEFETKLIIEVKNHLCLYAKHDPGYSNKQKRQAAWEDISCILGKSVDECQKKWVSLRDSFRSYWRSETNLLSGSGSTGPIKWIHFNTMRFLIPYIKIPADDCGNYSQEPCQDVAEFDDIIEVVEEDFSEIASPPSVSSAGSSNRKSRKRKAAHSFVCDEPIERVLSAIENLEKKKPMESFFECIAQQVEHFSQRRQVRFQFQRKILELLHEELQHDE